MEKTVQYKTTGTCCQMMQVKYDGDTIVDVDFLGGCHGNLQGIKSLVKGMKITDVIDKLSGIKCGSKPTSCPDQLAKCLSEVMQSI
jgi:uncharacterized protein (TIGR03905 family)